jgi:4-azaleucine resistance transporter AzlC
MTALLVVIFLEQWLKEDDHQSALIGMGLTLVSLLIFGSSRFVIPAMIAILLVLIPLSHQKEGLKE